MTSDYEVVVLPAILDFSYQLFVRKYVATIVYATPVDDTNMSINEEMKYGSPISGPIRIHILKTLECFSRRKWISNLWKFELKFTYSIKKIDYELKIIQIRL